MLLSHPHSLIPTHDPRPRCVQYLLRAQFGHGYALTHGVRQVEIVLCETAMNYSTIVSASLSLSLPLYLSPAVPRLLGILCAFPKEAQTRCNLYYVHCLFKMLPYTTAGVPTLPAETRNCIVATPACQLCVDSIVASTFGTLNASIT